MNQLLLVLARNHPPNKFLLKAERYFTALPSQEFFVGFSNIKIPYKLINHPAAHPPISGPFGHKHFLVVQ